VSYSTQTLSTLPETETNRANTARGAILELDATDSGLCNGSLLTPFRLKGWEAAGTRTDTYTWRQTTKPSPLVFYLLFSICNY